MTCGEFEQRLQDRLDSRQSIHDSELDLHAVRCDACRALHRRLEMLFEGYGSLAIPLVSGNFAERVRLEVARRRRESWKWGFGSIGAALATAAAVLLFISGHRRPPADPAGTIARHEVHVPVFLPPASPARLPIEEASVASRELIRDTAGPVSELATKLLPTVPVNRLVPSLEGPVQLVPERTRGVQARAQPLAAAVGQAFQFLRLPDSRPIDSPRKGMEG